MISKNFAQGEQGQSSEKGRAAGSPCPCLQEDKDVGVVPPPDHFETCTRTKVPPQVDSPCTPNGSVQDDRLVSLFLFISGAGGNRIDRVIESGIAWKTVAEMCETIMEGYFCRARLFNTASFASSFRS